MSIEPTSSGYRVRWRDPRNRARGGFKTRKAAEQFERHVKDLKAAGRLHELDETPPGEITLSEYVEQVWWPTHATQKVLQTRQGYATQWDLRIGPRWGQTKLRDIKPRGLNDWVKALREDTPAPTVLKALQMLQSILKMAVIDEEIPANPVPYVTKPSAKRTRKPVAISPIAVERIRRILLSPEPTVDRRGIPHPRANEHLRHRNATLVSVLAYAGPRPSSEALPMVWDQVGARSLTIVATKSGEPQERYVDLLEPLAEDLSAFWQHEGMPGKDQPIFGSWSKTDWDSWRDRVFKPAAIRAGLPRHVVPRDLRGSFASLLIAENRLSIIEIAAQLGHQPTETLNTYGRLFAEMDGVGFGRPAVDVIREARMTVEREKAMA